MFAVVLTIAAFNVGDMIPVDARPSQTMDFLTSDSVLRWINGYRAKPELAGVPHAVKALSRLGAFKDPEHAGAYVGFIAGVIGGNPDQAERLIDKMFPLPAENHWVIVRAIAHSSHPEWRRLLRVFAGRMPARKVMIEHYLAGQLPTLFQVPSGRTPTMGERLRSYVSYDTYFGNKKPPREALEPSPEVLDTYWGYYFATARYRPISRIVGMLALTKDGESIENLTLGNMAKYTLATNATRDAKLLAMLKRASGHKAKAITPALKDVIAAAETVETSRIRKEAMASIEELRRKGPASRRNVTWWGNVGTGAIALGCIAAAATGHVELGLPCVIGGGVSSAALKFWETQQ
ncbi:MAG: hypothetical protein ACRECO_05550 [Xanthobacteraceae bacterium]